MKVVGPWHCCAQAVVWMQAFALSIICFCNRVLGWNVTVFRYHYFGHPQFQGMEIYIYLNTHTYTHYTYILLYQLFLSSSGLYNFYCKCSLFFEEADPAKLISMEVESAQVEPNWRGDLIRGTQPVWHM